MWISNNKVEATNFKLISQEDIDIAALDNDSIAPLKSLIEHNADLSSIDKFWVNGDDKNSLNDALPHLQNIKDIVIVFNSFANGTGFSMAYQLKNNHLFKGKIWASGDIIPDQYMFLLETGFTGIHLPEKHANVDIWKQQYEAIDLTYSSHQNYKSNSENGHNNVRQSAWHKRYCQSN